MNTIHLRPYKEQDRAECLAMFKGNTPRFFSMTELPAFEQFLGSKSKQFFTVEDKARRVIGCGGVTLDAEKAIAGLCWGMIRNDMHGQGLGSFLLLARMVYISQQVPNCLVTNDTNQYACGFYERMGFRVTQVTHHHYALDVHRYDMERQLDADVCQKAAKALDVYEATIQYSLP
ncbi:MAG: GNAT family N-acetyltransferase [bacterium]|jgi:ribosomal protein S18 acetylase RimI-like enzyme|nr:GNAT family N-acetyltransferase [bacterium]